MKYFEPIRGFFPGWCPIFSPSFETNSGFTGSEKKPQLKSQKCLHGGKKS